MVRRRFFDRHQQLQSTGHLTTAAPCCLFAGHRSGHSRRTAQATFRCFVDCFDRGYAKFLRVASVAPGETEQRTPQQPAISTGTVQLNELDFQCTRIEHDCIRLRANHFPSTTFTDRRVSPDGDTRSFIGLPPKTVDTRGSTIVTFGDPRNSNGPCYCPCRLPADRLPA